MPTPGHCYCAAGSEILQATDAGAAVHHRNRRQNGDRAPFCELVIPTSVDCVEGGHICTQLLVCAGCPDQASGALVRILTGAAKSWQHISLRPPPVVQAVIYGALSGSATGPSCKRLNHDHGTDQDKHARRQQQHGQRLAMVLIILLGCREEGVSGVDHHSQRAQNQQSQGELLRMLVAASLSLRSACHVGKSEGQNRPMTLQSLLEA
mmetsp:Transcript_115395/g.162218  ORF Transcript_115395/g.162218 Transcript_115395/m.162218 type:complete len:208 (+) Transcript_115395:426-1049(+)